MGYLGVIWNSVVDWTMSISWKFTWSINRVDVPQLFKRSRGFGARMEYVMWQSRDTSLAIFMCIGVVPTRKGSKNHLFPSSRLSVLPIVLFAILIYHNPAAQDTYRMAEIRWVMYLRLVCTVHFLISLPRRYMNLFAQQDYKTRHTIVCVHATSYLLSLWI